MKNILRACLVLTEISSIVLLILTLIFVISGYGLIRTSIVRRLTFGLVNRHVAEFLHTNVYLRVFFNIFLIIHCLSGLTLVLHRRIRDRTLRLVSLIIVMIIVLYFTIPFTLLDLLE